MLKHENELGNVQYFIVRDEKPETTYEGPETYSTAEMDKKEQSMLKKRCFEHQSFFTEQI